MIYIYYAECSFKRAEDDYVEFKIPIPVKTIEQAVDYTMELTKALPEELKKVLTIENVFSADGKEWEDVGVMEFADDDDLLNGFFKAYGITPQK